MQSLIVTVNNQDMTVKEFRGQRVVTFKDVDMVHNRPEGTAGRNFRENKERFIAGEDYFRICPDEIRRNKIMGISSKVQQDMVFLTESGYLMLAKSFTDDLAWQVQRQLVKSYFKVKEQKESKQDRTEIMMMNARSRMAQTYMKLAQVDTLSSTYKNVLVSKASEVLAGEPIIPLPAIEQKKAYSAKDIGIMFGISANKVGRIANQHRLKTAPFGEYRRDKSQHSAHECDTWVYFDTVIPEFERILGIEVA
ncbi:ORF6N domain-containing protein [Lacrimispora sp. NSJ-141]|uniref:ORF6N domain-containing protein n=1 Tax=Lientehia hominis TaxID=2897778 RepID=A0AAP2RIQ8_9FIRM|nr:ORF6N domain-containing protein [Lientehia hominis]MCD2492727.1 ORF6N domain-containing protein [Lientehia hominis]